MPSFSTGVAGPSEVETRLKTLRLVARKKLRSAAGDVSCLACCSHSAWRRTFAVDENQRWTPLDRLCHSSELCTAERPCLVGDSRQQTLLLDPDRLADQVCVAQSRGTDVERVQVLSGDDDEW
jgi:hypothetical protein